MIQKSSKIKLGNTYYFHGEVDRVYFGKQTALHDISSKETIICGPNVGFGLDLFLINILVSLQIKITWTFALKKLKLLHLVDKNRHC